MRGEEFKQRALIEGKRYAKDRMVFLREFCQNARDAGASEIRVTTSVEGDCFVLRFQDDGSGMSLTHAKDYLFRLYASSKERQTSSAGCFGVGFWSVLLYAPGAIAIDSRTLNEPGWRVEMDGDLTAARTEDTSRGALGTEITIRKRLASGESYRSLTREARDALVRYCRYLRRDDRKARALPIYMNGEPMNQELTLDGPCYLTFGRGPVEGVVGMGETPSVEVFARGLLVWQGTLLDELRYGADRVEVARHPKGLAPRYVLNGNNLNVTYDRRALVDDAALARLRRVARWRMRELLARYLDQVSARSFWERAQDRFIAVIEELGLGNRWKILAGGAAIVAILLLVLGLLFRDSEDPTPEEVLGALVMNRRLAESRLAPEPIRLAPLIQSQTYMGPSVDPLSGLSTMALLYDPPLDLSFRIAAPERFDAGRGVRDVPKMRAGPLPELSCGGGCVSVAVQLAAVPGAMMLPVPTGYAAADGSLLLNGNPVSFAGVTQSGDPALFFTESVKGQLTYRVGPARHLLSETRRRILTALPPGMRVPRELEEQVHKLARRPDTMERARGARHYVANRFRYDTTLALSSRYRAYYRRNPTAGWLQFALQQGRGDCDVKNTVLVYLLRRLGIPSRLAVGPIGEKGALLPGMHAWVELYVSRWHVLDATLRDVGHRSDQVARAAEGAGEESSPEAATMSPGISSGEEPATSGNPVTPSSSGNLMASPSVEEPGSHRGFLKTVALIAAIVFALSLIVGVAALLVDRDSNPLYSPDDAAAQRSVAAEMVENALAHPEMWMASSSLMRRPLIPLLGRKKGLSLKEALARGREGSLWFSRGESTLAQKSVRRGGVILDSSDEAFETVVRRLPGIIDLDEISALAPFKAAETPDPHRDVGRLVDGMNRLLRRCGLRGLEIRLTNRAGFETCRDVDLGRLGFSSLKLVIVSVHTRSLKRYGDLAKTDPGLAVFLTMDILTRQSAMMEPFRSLILTRAAQTAVERKP